MSKILNPFKYLSIHFQILIKICYVSVYFLVFCFSFVYHQSSAYCIFFSLCYYLFSFCHRSYEYQHVTCICCILSCSVRHCSFQIGLCIPYHFPQYNTEHCCRQCITLSQASFCTKSFSQLTLDFYFSSLPISL